MVHRPAKSRKRGKAKPTVQSDSGAESDSEAEIEDKYVEELATQPKKKLRQLLPIKTKDGLQMQTEECEGTSYIEPHKIYASRLLFIINLDFFWEPLNFH